MSKKYGYVNARYIHNVSKKTGNHVTANVKRVAFYNVYGNAKDNPTREQRGNLYDQNGDTVNYGDYLAWAVGKTHQHNYTYRVIISPKGHMLTDKDFVGFIKEASQQHGVTSDFRLVVHRDTDHSHAHVMFHADKTIRRQELEAWKTTLREKMVDLETVRYQAQGMERPADDDKRDEDTAKPTPQKQSRQQRRRRRRSQKRDKGVEL